MTTITEAFEPIRCVQAPAKDLEGQVLRERLRAPHVPRSVTIGDNMEPDLCWFDLDDDHGVLELHERLTAGVGLELHVVVPSDGTGTLAWWVTEDGTWLAAAEVEGVSRRRPAV